MIQPKIGPVYLSPHLDDAALSCGGLIHQQARSGLRPLVVTCFAGVPDYHVLSPFAARLHRLWGQPTSPVERRRCEDAAAMNLLGADYEHWDYLDGIYRRNPGSSRFLYASEGALVGSLKPEDKGLIDELATRLAALLLGTPEEARWRGTAAPGSLSQEETLIFAPLAVGHHVDHQCVFHAALKLRDHGRPVWFYEDYPYAEEGQNLALAHQTWISPPKPFLRMLNEDDLQVKVNAIGLYKSQLLPLFGDDSVVSARVTCYALAVGAGRGYAERYWEMKVFDA
jgi:LmbE family N-acetylglucosaminyl deacetylase